MDVPKHWTMYTVYLGKGRWLGEGDLPVSQPKWSRAMSVAQAMQAATDYDGRVVDRELAIEDHGTEANSKWEEANS